MEMLIISTAGTGSRLGNITKNLNKALIPFKDKPTLSHIIEKFPKNLPILILVGYKKEQIIDYCELVHGDRKISFVEVDDYTSALSGTAYSLKKARSYVNQPFWYVACDTYFEETFFNTTFKDNIYFVKEVSEKTSQQYCMFKVKQNRICDIKNKEKTSKDYVAFVGLMYIHRYEEFFNNLDKIKTTEAVDAIKVGDSVEYLNTWLDFGNLDCYLTAAAKSKKFDYSKNDEITYIDNNKVIKWWLDSTIPDKKIRKTYVNKKLFPREIKQKNNWIVYDFFPGQTLYQHNNVKIMPEFLHWLETEVWKSVVDSDIKLRCKEFYEVKTLARVAKFLSKYPSLPDIKTVNGVPVKHYLYYLKNIDWNLLINDCRSYFIHGDLQFDNVVVSDSKEFKLIDWRHEFANKIESGDLYYDYAKMLGGCYIDYSQIKEHNFKIEITDNDVTLSIPHLDDLETYVKHIKESAVRLNLNYEKIKALVPLIYWNMSPLHGEPYDLFLWYLGIKLFEMNDL